MPKITYADFDAEFLALLAFRIFYGVSDNLRGFRPPASRW